MGSRGAIDRCCTIIISNRALGSFHQPPLFRAPVNRTLAEFEADTTEHGWPSFRPAEVETEHVVTDKTTGLVTSSCGTHLGSFLPDSAGARWCMDLSCVSGNQA